MLVKKIAYKVAKGLTNLPDGFIIEHFDTFKDDVEGYQITSVENFNVLFAKNGPLLHQFEISKNEESIKNATRISIKDVSELSDKIKAAANTTKEENKDAELFKQFLAWKASQTNNS